MTNDKLFHPSSLILHPFPRSAGFTLLEVVCVLAITSIVLATVFGVLTTTVRAIRGTREILRENRVASGIGRVLRRDFNSAYREREEGLHTVTGGGAVGPEGGVSLAFFTTNSFLSYGRRSPAALSRVEYILRPSERAPGLYAIIRKETPHALGEGGEPAAPEAAGWAGDARSNAELHDEGTHAGSRASRSERLADGLSVWRVRFHDGVEWRDEWRRNKLPMALRLDLAFGGVGEDLSAEASAKAEGGETCTLFFSPLADPDADPLPSKRTGEATRVNAYGRAMRTEK